MAGTARLKPPVASTSHADTLDTRLIEEGIDAEPATPGASDVNEEDVPTEASELDVVGSFPYLIMKLRLLYALPYARLMSAL